MNAYSEAVYRSRAFSAFKNAAESGKLAQAYLAVCGENDLLSALTESMLQCIYCNTHTACGECAACSAVINKAMAEITYITAQSFKAHDCAALIENSYLSGLSGKIKVYVIEHMGDMRPDMQNKLLKFLEEPPSDTVFLLTDTRDVSILATIKSRCSKIYIECVSHGNIIDILVGNGIDSVLAEKISLSSAGNLSRALEYSNDGAFESNYRTSLKLITKMQSSRDIPVYACALKSENIKNVLNILESILRNMLLYMGSGNVELPAELADASCGYTVAAVSGILDLIVRERVALKFSGNVPNIADGLSVGILEVKFKCQ